MNLTELALLIVAIASVVAVVLLAVAVVSITRLLREVRAAAALPRTAPAPVVLELGESVRRAGLELEPVDRAPSPTRTVPRLAYVPFAHQVIKGLAIASGTGRAARSFRRERSR